MIPNPDLIRGILLDVEQRNAPVESTHVHYPELTPPPTPEEIARHMGLLGDVGYAEVKTVKDETGMICHGVVIHITKQGYDFLESVR